MKATTPMMMPKKQAKMDRIMKARVASQYAVQMEPGISFLFFLQFSNVYTVFCVHDVSPMLSVCVMHFPGTQ